MEKRHLLIIDEQDQIERLNSIKDGLHKKGIDLVYKYVNPSSAEFQTRIDGKIQFDKQKFKDTLSAIDFLSYLDVFATDHNLIDKTLYSIDVISIFYDLLPNYCHSMVIYSATIEDVIKNIITDCNFEEQVLRLKLLARDNISFLKSDKDFLDKLGSIIQKEPDITIDDKLSETFCSLKGDRYRCSLPSYVDLPISTIGNILSRNTPDRVPLRKQLVVAILADVIKIDDYE